MGQCSAKRRPMYRLCFICALCNKESCMHRVILISGEYCLCAQIANSKTPHLIFTLQNLCFMGGGRAPAIRKYELRNCMRKSMQIAVQTRLGALALKRQSTMCSIYCVLHTKVASIMTSMWKHVGLYCKTDNEVHFVRWRLSVRARRRVSAAICMVLSTSESCRPDAAARCGATDLTAVIIYKK